MMELFLTLLLGSFVGISSALLGLGGNILIVPILPLISELPLPSVIATGIFTVFIVTFFNVINFYRQNLIDLSLIFLLFIPTSVASYLSSHFSNLVPAHIIKSLFIVIMMAMVLRLFLSRKIKAPTKKKKARLLLIGAGFLSGLLAGLTGVGTGIMLAPLLLSLNITDEKKSARRSTSLLWFLVFFSSMNYLSFDQMTFPQSGLVRLDMALSLAAPALFTAIIGRKLNSNISPRWRKIIVGSVLTVLILKTL